jgi:hypothetical protein
MEKYKLVRFRLKENLWQDIIKKRADMCLEENQNVSFNEVMNRIIEEYFEKCSRRRRRKKGEK